jgi:hypothetical protein
MDAVMCRNLQNKNYTIGSYFGDTKTRIFNVAVISHKKILVSKTTDYSMFQ